MLQGGWLPTLPLYSMDLFPLYFMHRLVSYLSYVMNSISALFISPPPLPHFIIIVMINNILPEGIKIIVKTFFHHMLEYAV